MGGERRGHSRHCVELRRRRRLRLLVEVDGSITDDLWEKDWTVELPMDWLDQIAGPIYLVFEAKVDGVPLAAPSQVLLVHRTRFSS